MSDPITDIRELRDSLRYMMQIKLLDEDRLPAPVPNAHERLSVLQALLALDERVRRLEGEA